ncbi:thioredoxin family protein [Halovenus sp. WSH3]|uniref:Thioredoxin family protein n=1 Tax=Halovenus carboxidivorans TaxID=2692199 RepID=A0A6B0TFA2_9EURY|nr:thioredoxin family protein [Halovenus carboxidivorans]MXR51869.1 thioredoxin family protein [Halovenus carboxidivorans]
MPLETLEPNPAWVADAYADTIDELEAHNEEITYKIWCGDWCKDCRATLPDFGAALEEANVPSSRVIEHPLDEDKQGEGVEEYGIERIPTVVAERDGEEIARFVEDEGLPIAVYFAERFREQLSD